MRNKDILEMSSAVSEIRKTDLLEELAELEHEQWRSWTLELIDTEDINTGRLNRWMKIIKKNGYKNLTEEEKDQDREYAEKVLFTIKKYMGLK